jgi:hypothetical protein
MGFVQVEQKEWLAQKAEIIRLRRENAKLLARLERQSARTAELQRRLYAVNQRARVTP